MKGVKHMKDFKRLTAAVIAAAAVISTAVSCSSKKKDSNKEKATEAGQSAESTTAKDTSDSAGKPDTSMEIYWLSDYDINPAEGEKRSTALSLFEDVYNGKVTYLPTTAEDKYNELASQINAGAAVDMFPYDAKVFPDGVMRDLFAPLDPYYEDLGMDSGIWDEMSGVIDMFAYKGQHYVMPYSISDPFVLTYSRKLMQSEGIDDPRKLWQEGKWDWNALKSMIEKFKSNNPGAYRIGINGWYGQAALASTGHRVVEFDGNTLKNNIYDPEIANAVSLTNDILLNGWYSANWRDTFPTDFNTLFLASTDWTLPISNAANPEADLMIVPFPKEPNADKNYISCNFDARMLVKNSDNSNAVATYIKCERLAASDETMKKKTKEYATTVHKNQSGTFRSFVTEEQYDALMEYTDLSKVTPVFDYGYGMGDAMTGYGAYTNDTRGAMYRITDTEVGKDWEAIKNTFSPVIDEQIAQYNN